MQTSSSPARKKFLIAFAVFLVSSALLTVWLTTTRTTEKPDAAAKPAAVGKKNSVHDSVLARAEEKTSDTSPQATSVAAATTASVPLAGCEAVMKTADGKSEPTKLTGSDGLFDRVMVKADEPISLQLTLPHLAVGKEIIISAPNGGKIARAEGGALRYKASATEEKLNLVFQPGKSLGAYSVIVMHQGVSQTLDFWVGPQHPLGQPGPTLSLSTPINR